MRLDRHRGTKTNHSYFKTSGSAKAAITRESNRNIGINASDFAIAPSTEFYNTIEKTRIVKNLMTGKDVVQSVNTPLCLDVSSETYWST